MLTTKSNARIADLDAVRSDSLLKLIALANADPRPDKIDVGVGVYRDGQGRTPVMRAVKAAEKKLWETQDSKSYLGGAGDTVFPELLQADRARRACRRRAHRRLADAGRLRGAAPRLPAGAAGQSVGAGAGRPADLAEPCADHRRLRARAGRISLLRPRRPRDPVRRDDGGDRSGQRRRRRPAARLLPQSDRRRL